MIQKWPAFGYLFIQIENSSLVQVWLHNFCIRATCKGRERRLKQVVKLFSDVEDDWIRILEWLYNVKEVEHELTEEKFILRSNSNRNLEQKQDQNVNDELKCELLNGSKAKEKGMGIDIVKVWDLP